MDRLVTYLAQAAECLTRLQGQLARSHLTTADEAHIYSLLVSLKANLDSAAAEARVLLAPSVSPNP